MKRSLLIAMAGVISVSAMAQNRPTRGRAAIFNNHMVSIKPSKENMKETEYTVPYALPVTPSVSVGQPSVHRVLAPSLTEDKIGETVYDLQSNRGAGRRIWNNPNGTISAVWTTCPNGTTLQNTLVTQRGTGYNYFDGTNWGPISSTRIDAVRTGFPNIFVSNGTEYITNHYTPVTNVNAISMLKRSVGTGAWTTVSPVGTYTLYPNQSDVWSRMAVSGPNGEYVHMITNSQGAVAAGAPAVLGQNGPLTYSRSSDGGATWTIDHIQLDGMDVSWFLGFSAENYSIDARGNNVAIVAGGYDTDLVLWKSTDNGDNWTKTFIFQFPEGHTWDDGAQGSWIDVDNDGLNDTIVVPAQDPTVTLDKNGMAHVAVGSLLIYDDDTNATSTATPTGINLFLSVNVGIQYWNESKPEWTVAGLLNGDYEIAAAHDENGDGEITLPFPVPTSAPPAPAYGIYGGLYAMTVQPTIGFDDNNDIFVSYATVNEDADTTIFAAAHRHIYVTRSNNGGDSWGVPFNILPNPAHNAGEGEYYEAVWPSIERDIPGSGASACAKIIYQRDNAPYYSAVGAGASTTDWLATHQGWNQDAGNQVPYINDIIVATVCDVPVGISKINSNVTKMTVSPNPAKDVVRIEFDLNKSENIQLEMTDVTGRVVMSDDLGNVNSGKTIKTVNVSKLSPGVYIYNLKSAQGNKSGKLVVE